MSSKLQGYVWDACAVSGVKGTRLMVMVRLADYSSDDGKSYPGIKTIARQLGAGESTIRTAIAELESEKWLRRENRRNGNRNTSNMYFLNVEKLEEIALRERAAIRLKRCKNNRFDPSDSDASGFDQSDFDASEMSASSALAPSDSGKNNRFDPSDSGGHDPQGLKPDPQVKDHELQEVRAKRQKKSSFDPAGLKPENVSAEIWQDWIKFRREKRQPLTETTCTYQAKQLAGHQNADEVIRRSIASGWQGLFPDHVPNKPATMTETPGAAVPSEPDSSSWYTPSGNGSAEVFINQAAIERMKRGGYRQ
ncbi:helix-turn-helix domain-containing protein [Salmonella enterica]|uniref:Helix-turn-helix domain-containing protein n=1 Tax=Salmonella diarizonae TaxID=59204 RepID=A0A702DYF1_SALDZ|nr:helix-turn-helix domain-containing protein [Salmonella enterica]EHG3719691.1 helix-turn-helix domain-containing protein [Salmonella enterica subsp. diarizonae serovar 11:k:z53]EKR1691975.1 helix-turn-helix domain-containing protein [Salmonella enterica subsp. diarizonae serovar 6,7,14:k:z50]HAC6770985.1 helix-turn-helix domain-containing protein [Salmonella enterica subsp. diarizonae]EHM6602894.1 helix-turn-helix domain-containing protein [Salmonella enterica]